VRARLFGWTAVASVAIGTALACGPEFPMMLTKCREVCLQQIMAFSFQAEIDHLGEQSRPRRVAEQPTPPSFERATAFEKKELAPEQAAIVAAVRAARSDEDAYALGEGLPEAIRLYTAGAVDFNRVFPPREWNEMPRVPTRRLLPPEQAPLLDRAIERFEAIIALPPEDRAAREVWAAYMLGRARYARNGAGDVERAGEAFRRTVSLVRGGAEDPLGLANAALGELGWLELERSRIGDAIDFYVEQRSEASLLRVADEMYFAPERMDGWLADVRTQRLLVAYLGRLADTTCRGSCYRTDVITPVTSTVITEAVSRVVALPRDRIESPDQWAAVAYAIGQYDAADGLLGDSRTGYAFWIKAKLALHRGDVAAAENAFAQASHSFPVEARAVNDARPYTWAAPLYQRLVGEHALLSLSRGEYVEALNQLIASGAYWPDVDYVAEKVLTVDELKSFIDRIGEMSSSLPRPLLDRVRDLLARRLARDDRFAEAVNYYVGSKTKANAARYAEARAVAVSGEGDSVRARGWYEVAKLEVRDGMELRGASTDPDWFPGDYSGPGMPSPAVTAEESPRVEASAVRPARRFHYREVGIEHLMMSADLLPSESEAFAVVLCQGVSWLLNARAGNERDLIDRVYLRYLREGRAEPWAENFGRNCPEPRFE
jgi:tetratricopeptide (TPR) repeat protein